MQQSLFINLQKQIDYFFKNSDYLICALTHKSFPVKENNQILEFLGDSVLNLVISERLVERFETATEGELTRMRALLVRGPTLVKLALTLNLDKLLRLGSSQRKFDCPPSALEDALEALIGAVHLDGGFQASRRCVDHLWRKNFLALNLETLELDAKSELQVYCQQEKISLPHYDLEKIAGRPPNEIFFVKAWTNSFPCDCVREKGASKKEAEQKAAFKLLNYLKK